MSHRQPLRIGLSARIMHDTPRELGFHGKTLQYLEQSIAHWIMAHGALAFMIPTLVSGGEVEVRGPSLNARDYVASLDGLLLQGGSDVSPESYGKSPLDPAWNGDRIRDRYEIELLREFVSQGKPVLGVCRGAQLINVAFGGTLYQDIPTQIPGAIAHRDFAVYDDLSHAVRLEPGSLLAQLYPGAGEAHEVTSIHHQAIDALGDGLVVEARSVPDGVIEAVRWTGASYVVGVQWHPEFHDRAQKELLDDTPLLLEFLRRVEERRRRSIPTSEGA